MAFPSFISLITPFKTNKEIDFESLDHLILSHQKTGEKNFLLASDAGEGVFLSFEEKISLFKRTRLVLGDYSAVYFKENSFDLMIQSLFAFKKLGLSKGYVDLSLIEKAGEGEVFDFCFSLSKTSIDLILEPPKHLFTQKFLDQIEALPFLTTPCSRKEREIKSHFVKFDINTCLKENELKKQNSYLKNFTPFFSSELQTNKEMSQIKKEEEVLVAKHLLSSKGIILPYTRMPGFLSDCKKKALLSLVP